MSKHLVGMMLAFAVGAIPASAQQEAGWWTLDETSGTQARDSSSNANHGTHANGPTISSNVAPLLFPNPRCLSFDGTNDCVTIPMANLRSISDTFTFSFWAQPTAARSSTGTGTGGITGTSGQRYVWFPVFDSSFGGAAAAGVSVGNNGISVFIHAGGLMPALLVYPATFSGWTHIAVVFNNRTPTLYIGGTSVATGLNAGRTLIPTGTMGGNTTSPWSGYGPYAGGLDDFRIYPRALSAAEVANLALGFQTVNGNPGTPPNPAANVRQIGTSGADVAVGGWTGRTVTFAAELSDPDSTHQVFLQVEVKAAGAAWTGVPTLSSPMGPQGPVQATYTLPSAGSYEWRYRVGNSAFAFEPNNGGMPTWTEFSPGTSSFQSDQAAPTSPTAVSPTADVTIKSFGGAPVSFEWTSATDNGPSAAITYEIEAGTDASFATVEVSATGVSGLQTALFLAPMGAQRYWRARAYDVGGNAGAWSPVASFRVTLDDGIDHGSGDASKACGFSAGSAGSSAALALLALAIAAAGFRK